MTAVWHLARRDLRAFFRSPVALLFLGTFVVATTVLFFWVGDFFEKGVADAGPLFQYLTWTLPILVGALAMRLWTDEQSKGTIEVLRTMPLPTWTLVLGKYLAGFIILALSLFITIVIPICVSMMGNMDWGPVLAGYLSSLLLGSMFLAIGLTISAMTKLEVAALIGTIAACLFFHVPSLLEPDTYGATAGEDGFWAQTQYVIASLGLDHRFGGVGRGIIDIRNLAYFASFSALFLVLSGVILAAKRWGQSAASQKTRRASLLSAGLIVLNVIALNTWLTPVSSLRADVTEDKLYSISDASKDYVATLKTPVTVTVYLSRHRELISEGERMLGLLEELVRAGDGKITVEVVNPATNDKGKERTEEAGIKPIPLPSGTGIDNAYFGIVVSVGDKSESLQFLDLLSYRFVGLKLELSLKNIELNVVKAIRKASVGFNTLEQFLRSYAGKAQLLYYRSEILQGSPSDEAVAQAVSTVRQTTGDKLEYKVITPKTEEDFIKAQENGVQPTAAMTETGLTLIMHSLVLAIDDKRVIIPVPQPSAPGQGPSGSDELAKNIEKAIEQAAPGFLPIIGVVEPKAEPAPANPNNPFANQRSGPPQSFYEMIETLRRDYQAETVGLAGEVPFNIEALIVAGPEDLTETEVKNLDQYLMRGGTVILLSGRFRPNRQRIQFDLSADPVNTGLDEWLKNYGVSVEPRLVHHDKELAQTQVGEQEITQFEFSPFLRLGRDRTSRRALITRSLDQVVMHWASPITLDKDKLKQSKLSATELIWSPKDAWTTAHGKAEPTEDGVTRPSGEDVQTGKQLLAVEISGAFESAFAPKANDNTASDSEPERLLTKSPDHARLVVIGSSAFVSDEVRMLTGMLGTPVDYEENLRLIDNSIQLAVGQTELLHIPSRRQTKRDLSPKLLRNESTQNIWKGAALLMGLTLTFLIGLAGYFWRPQYVTADMLGTHATPSNGTSSAQSKNARGTGSDRKPSAQDDSELVEDDSEDRPGASEPRPSDEQPPANDAPGEDDADEGDKEHE